MDFTSFAQDLSVVFMKIALGGSFLTWDFWKWVWAICFAIGFYQLSLKYKGDFRQGFSDVVKFLIYAGVSQLLLGGPMYRSFGQDAFTSHNSISARTSCVAPVFSGGEVSYEMSSIGSPRKKEDYFHSHGKNMTIDFMSWLSWHADALSDTMFCQGVGGRMADNISALGDSFGNGFMSSVLCYKFSGVISDSDGQSAVGTSVVTQEEYDSSKPTQYLKKCLQIVADKDKTFVQKFDDVKQLGKQQESLSIASIGDQIKSLVESLFGHLLYFTVIINGLILLGPMMGSMLALGGFALLIIYLLSLIFNFIMTAVFAATMALSLVGFIMVSPLMMIENLRDRVVQASKVPLSTCFYGWAANFISWVGNLFTLATIYQVNVIGASGGSAAINFSNMVMMSIVSMIVMIVVLGLQSWTITKVPKLAHGLVSLDFGVFTTIGQEIMDTVKTVGGGTMMMAAGVASGGLSAALGSAGKMAANSSLGKGIGKFGSMVADNTPGLRNFRGGRGQPPGAGPIPGGKPPGGGGGGGKGGGGSGFSGGGPSSNFTETTKKSNTESSNEKTGGGTTPEAKAQDNQNGASSGDAANDTADKVADAAFGGVTDLSKSPSDQSTAKTGFAKTPSGRTNKVPNFDSSPAHNPDKIRKDANSHIDSPAPSLNNEGAQNQNNSEAKNDQGEAPDQAHEPNYTNHNGDKFSRKGGTNDSLKRGLKKRARAEDYDNHKDVVNMYKERHKAKRKHKNDMIGQAVSFFSNAYDAGVTAAGGGNFNMNFKQAADMIEAHKNHKKQMAKDKDRINQHKQNLATKHNKKLREKRKALREKKKREAEQSADNEFKKEQAAREAEFNHNLEVEKMKAQGQAIAEAVLQSLREQGIKPSRKKKRGRRNK